MKYRGTLVNKIMGAKFLIELGLVPVHFKAANVMDADSLTKLTGAKTLTRQRKLVGCVVLIISKLQSWNLATSKQLKRGLGCRRLQMAPRGAPFLKRAASLTISRFRRRRRWCV